MSRPIKPTGLFAEEDEEVVMKPTPKPVKLPNLQAFVGEKAGTEESEEKPWIKVNLVVKCLNRELSSGKYFNRIGMIQRIVEGGWGAEVIMADTKDILLLDQDECGTTLPKAGGDVRIVQGTYRGGSGRFVEVSPDGKEAVVDVGEPRGMRGRRIALSLSHVCQEIN